MCLLALKRKCAYIMPFTTLCASSIRSDTGEPSEGPSKDDSDIREGDSGILLGKMSKEEQRRRYPYVFVDIRCKHQQGLLI